MQLAVPVLVRLVQLPPGVLVQLWAAAAAGGKLPLVSSWQLLHFSWAQLGVELHRVHLRAQVREAAVKSVELDLGVGGNRREGVRQRDRTDPGVASRTRWTLQVGLDDGEGGRLGGRTCLVGHYAAFHAEHCVNVR